MEIIHIPQKDSIIKIKNSNFSTSCMSCIFPYCIKYEEKELKPSNKSFEEFPLDFNDYVCLTGALSWKKGELHPHINLAQCILCGLCASRCPIGAIYLTKEGAIINTRGKAVEIVEANSNNIQTHLEHIRILNNIKHTGLMINESDSLFLDIYNKVAENRTGPQFPNMLTRNLLIQTGNSCFMRRRGDIYFRIDAI